VEKLFSPGDMDDFLHDYNRWNGDQADDLGDRSEKFLRKAARLGVARALALMLLLTDKQHPLTLSLLVLRVMFHSDICRQRWL